MSKRRRARKSRIKQRERRQQLIIIGSLVGIVVVFIAILGYNILNAPPDVAEARLEQEAVLGQPNARVEIVEYGAYGCSACKSFHESDTIERLIETYGDVQFMFRNRPIIGPNDRLAAEVAQCALDQGDDDFWAMHDAMYTLPTEDLNDSSEGDFVDLAREEGLDGDALETCLDERTHERTVDYWHNYGGDLGINTTPTFYVNGVPLGSSADLEAAVAAALN